MLISKIRDIEELLISKKNIAKIIVSRDKKIPEPLYKLIRVSKIPIYKIPDEVFKVKFSKESGIAAITGEIEFVDVKDILTKSDKKGFLRILLIDEIEDPQNVGAMVRSCACFGFSGIIMTSRRTSFIGEGVIKASAGTIFHQKIARVNNLSDAIEKLKKEDIWFVGTDSHSGLPLWEIDFKRNIGIVMGNEERGVRKKIIEHCDYVARIPITEGEDSLNVSVAFGIIAYESSKYIFS
jgi:23S rRNA (guanosine2251-2'-O)-methyltransferase